MNSLQNSFHRQLLLALRSEKIVTLKRRTFVAKTDPKKTPHPEEKFSYRVNCTLSKKEYTTLKNFSDKQEISHTKLLKNLAFSSLEKRKIFSPSGEKILRGLVIEIRRIGTNINQIAKQANTLQKVGFSDLHQAHKRISELEKILLEAIKYYSKK